MSTGDFNDIIHEHTKNSFNNLLSGMKQEFSTAENQLRMQMANQSISGSGLGNYYGIAGVAAENQNYFGSKEMPMWAAIRKQQEKYNMEDYGRKVKAELPGCKNYSGLKFMRLHEEFIMKEGGDFEEPLDRLRVDISRWLGKSGEKIWAR